MRKVSIQAAEKFHAGQPFKSKNTEVRIETHNTFTPVRMFLYGRVIAQRDIHDWDFQISTTGFPTMLTKSRLNALGSKYSQGNYDLHIYTYRGQIYLSGQPWSGEPTYVGEWHELHGLETPTTEELTEALSQLRWD